MTGARAARHRRRRRSASTSRKPRHDLWRRRSGSAEAGGARFGRSGRVSDVQAKQGGRDGPTWWARARKWAGRGLPRSGYRPHGLMGQDQPLPGRLRGCPGRPSTGPVVGLEAPEGQTGPLLRGACAAASWVGPRSWANSWPRAASPPAATSWCPSLTCACGQCPYYGA